jgi:hypothetical protein
MESNPVLADLTTEAMQSRGWSFRRAQRETGSAFTSIERMAKGVPVESETLMKFAATVSAPADRPKIVLKYLRAGGKNEIAAIIEDMIAQSLPPRLAGELPDDVAHAADLFAAADTTHREIALLVLGHGAD